MTPDTEPNPLTAESLFCESLPNLPRAWDSVMLGLIKRCARKFYYVIIRGIQGTGFAAHLSFGIALHKALETYDRDKAGGADHEEALLNAIAFCMSYGFRDAQGVFHAYDTMYTNEPTKTRDTLLRAVIWYLIQHKDDTCETVRLANGEPAVELSFKINLTNFLTPDGDPFILCGHIDRLVEYEGHYYWMDRKTTKSALTPYYFAQFTPNNQMSLYHTASQIILAEPARGGIIDGIQLGVNFARFQRQPITRTKEQLREWMKDTQHFINLAMQYASEDYWPQNDTACGDYGGCEFRFVCGKSPSVREAFIANEGFVERKWNPLESR